MTYFYFALLDLSFDTEWDQEKFEQALRQKQAEWSTKSTGVGMKAVQAKTCLDLIPDIQTIMSDPIKRKEHIDDFRMKKSLALNREIEWYQKQKSVTHNELDKFIEEYKDVASQGEIMARLNVPVHHTDTAKPRITPGLDSSTLNGINEELEQLGKNDLYDWLGLPQTTHEVKLANAAKRMYEEAVHAMSPSRKMIAQKKLASFASSIFSSPEKHGQYDHSLYQHILDGLLQELDRRMSRKSAPALSQDLITYFLQQACDAGYSEEDAYDKLLKHAVQRGWMLRSASIEKETQKRYNSDYTQNLIEHKHYYAAQQFLNKLEPDMLDQAQESLYHQHIHTAISRAEKELSLVRTSTFFMPHEEKIVRCRTALHYCADFRDAQDFLSELLPVPRNLQATKNNTTVLLKWDHTLQDFQYKIIRKYYVQPDSDLDGQLLATISDNAYQDTTAEIGIPVYYAIFTICDEVTSLTSAILRIPVLLTTDVTDIKVHYSNRLIEFNWQAPPNLYNLIVKRKEKTAPSSIHDGITIVVQDLTHVIDHRVQNHITYYYAIYCQFKDHEERIETTDGIIIEAIAGAHPEVIRDLIIEHNSLSEGFNVQIRWNGSSNNGEIALLKTELLPLLKEGEVIPTINLQQFGEIVRVKQQPQHDFWPVGGVRYYTPVILLDDKAYVGKPHRYNCVEEVSNLTFQQLGNLVRLQWQWPSHCREVNISYRTINNMETSVQNTRNTYRITHEEYKYFGYYDLKCAVNQDYAIMITTIIEQGGEQFHSSGVYLDVRVADRIVVDYEIKKKFMRRGWYLILYTNIAITLPAFRVVCQRHRLPHHKEDGEVIFSFGETGFIDKELSFLLGEESYLPDTFARLFLEDEHAAGRLQFRLPHREKLRLD